MDVDPARTKHSIVHEGKDYFFCSASCLEKFRREPEKYLVGGSAGGHEPTTSAAPAVPAAPAAKGVEYTCPMHPQIVRDAPGLVPDLRHGARAATRHAADGGEPRARRHDAGGSGSRVALTVPLLAAGDGATCCRACRCGTSSRRGFDAGSSSRSRRRWCSWGGMAVLRARGAVARATAASNMFTLIALGVGVAYVYSLVATLAPGLFPAVVPRTRRRRRRLLRGRRRHRHAGAARPGAGAAGAQPDRRARSGRCSGLAPKTARRVRDDGSEEDVPLDDVQRRRSAARAARREGPGRRRRPRGPAPSTSRWSPASRSRSRRARATASSAPPSTAPAAS